MAKAGRPSNYTPELADEICAQLAEGISLRTICLDDAMPCKSAVFNWLRTNKEFADQYARAKEESADALVEDILDIADDGSNDWMEKHDKDGKCVGYQLNGENVQRSRLRVDTRKWYAAKLKPKKYGDRVATELTGRDGGPVETVDVTEREVARRIAFALTQGIDRSEESAG